MSRYRGYTEQIEVLIDLLDEQRKTNDLLEKLLEKRDEDDNKPEATATRQRSNKRGSNNDK